MLKRILILMLCSPIFLCIHAQRSFEPSTYIGIHGGVNASALDFNPSVKQDLLISNGYGIVFRHVSEPNIGLQIEVNMAGKGWKEIIDSVGTYTRRLQTIDIPVMAVFIAGSKRLRFAFTVGPYLSYLRDDKEKTDITNPQEYKPHYFKPLINNWEFGFAGGLGIEVHTKAGVFAVRASYNHSLTNIFPLNKGEYYFLGSRNQVIHGGLMYMFEF